MTGESTEATAAVGRVIQRTMSLPPTAGSGARTPSGSPARMLLGASVPAPPAVGAQPQFAALQRSGASVGAYPAPTRAEFQPWAAESGAAGPAPVGFRAGQAGVVVPGRLPETAAPLALNRTVVAPPEQGQSQNVLQRDDAQPAAPGSVPDASGQASTSVPVVADGGLSSQGTGETVSPELPGLVPRGPGQSGAAGPGNTTGQASPEQLEELAKRLAGPLIRRIKAEMLLDRERRGLRTDVN